MNRSIRSRRRVYGTLVTAFLLAGLFSAGIFASSRVALIPHALAADIASGNSNMNMSANMGNNMTTMTPQHGMVMQGYHVLKGQISNVQLGSDGTPAWIQFGIWVLRATLGGDSNSGAMELQSAQFFARFTMVKPDGTAP